MSKSVLLIDTPKNCHRCPMKYDYRETDVCAAKDEMIYDCLSKPDWCPLLPLPEKYEIKNILCDRFYDWEYEYGYNACIDYFLGGEDDT